MKVINSKLNAFLEKDEDKQLELWDEAVKFYHEKKYDESIRKLTENLDPDSKISVENGKTKFELIQGSVVIYCRYTDKTFYAYINVLHVDYPDPIVFRRLLNLNSTTFSSCKASIVKDYIRLTTETLIELASPAKIYWDLHELSTHGDKLDDVLSIYSKGVREIDFPSTKKWEQPQINIGIKYLRIWLNESLKKSEFWYNKNDLYVASWWLLGRMFSILYFVQPEGKLFEEFVDIVDDYNSEERSQDENIKRVINRIRKILKFTDEELKDSFFSTKYTFQINKSVNREMIVKYLEASLNSANRFKSLGHLETEYMSLIYSLGLLLNHYVMDRDFTEELAKEYEAAHIDFMNEFDPSRLKKLYKNYYSGIKDRLKGFLGLQADPTSMKLTNNKDRSAIIKNLRNLYEDILAGDA